MSRLAHARAVPPIPSRPNRRAGTRRKLSVPLALAFALALPGCVAQSLPGMAGDPQTPPGTTPEVPIAGSGEGIVVEYFAMCRGCSVQFSTPEGIGAEDEIDGTFRRRVRFSNVAGPGAVTLTVTPVGTGRVQSARIRLDAEVVAEAGPLPVGEAASLSAVVR